MEKLTEYELILEERKLKESETEEKEEKEKKQYYEVENNNYQVCGHKHRTYEAAEKCYEKLTEYSCSICGKKKSQSHRGHYYSAATSAKWYNSHIHEIR